MIGKLEKQLQDDLSAIREAGLYKEERIITSPQGPVVYGRWRRSNYNVC